ncbi:MAG: hypothetical protein F4Z57_16935 [Gemmatimonadetes bacterium]|nr:hypothetical protein [Gemmatimonadota bacterium]MYC71754.1 hypothetical protein [Gemmatimonadota bacterium]MYI60417.1 hypothetical protein [Gemmatimonadota bacterium]
MRTTDHNLPANRIRHKPRPLRILARLFIVLFCLTFICNQALSQESQSNVLLDMMGKTVGKLIVFSAKSFSFLAELSSFNSQRLNAIEAHLAKTSGYQYVELDTVGLHATKDELEQARADLFDYLQGKQSSP